jgi:hypothetical protein
MATSDNPALVDTNVLVYAPLPEADEHGASRALFERAQSGVLALCLAPQVLGLTSKCLKASRSSPRRVSAPSCPPAALSISRGGAGAGCCAKAARKSTFQT